MSGIGGQWVELETLAARAAGGDDVAFGQLARALRPLLRRWALVQTGDADDAEDVMQAALLRIHRGLGSFQGESRLTTWVHAVVRRSAADWRRSRGRRRERDARYGASVADATSPAEALDRQRLLSLVNAQLGQLSARQREVFDLVDLQGHSPLEAAELLGMNHNTVRAHLLRARRTLRARILAARPALVEDA